MPTRPAPPSPWKPAAWLHRPHFTNQARLPWAGVSLLNLVWFCEVYNVLLHGVGLTFVARRFTSDPRVIVLVSTVGILAAGSIGPLVNFLSERVGTRWGRRRPLVAGAYLLSAIGLAIIPFMDSLGTLLVAATLHACVHAFASPLEPLYMELVPQSQQGRSQAIRNVCVQACVICFFQLALVQFDEPFPHLDRWVPGAGTVTGVHLAFWTGSALLLTMSVFLAACTREHPAAAAASAPGPGASWWRTLRSFPREVFADWRWWPAYGLYTVPILVTGVWGNLQPLMVVEQFGFSLTEMARIGLPVSLVGMALTAPLLGYALDRYQGDRPGALLLLGCLLAGLAAMTFNGLPSDSRQLPGLAASLLFCVPLELAAGCLLVGATAWRGDRPGRFSLRSRIIFIAVAGQALLALVAWTATHLRAAEPGTIVSLRAWLAYLALSQVLALTLTLALMPLLFSRIPASRFGTVSSGFGIFSTVATSALGNLGGLWVHGWARWDGGTPAPYSSLWLLQFAGAITALLIMRKCLRTPLMAGEIPPAGPPCPAPHPDGSGGSRGPGVQRVKQKAP